MVRALYTHTHTALHCTVRYGAIESTAQAGKDTLNYSSKRQQFFGAPRASKNPHQESRQSTTSSLHHPSVLVHPDLESFLSPKSRFSLQLFHAHQFIMSFGGQTPTIIVLKEGEHLPLSTPPPPRHTQDRLTPRLLSRVSSAPFPAVANAISPLL